MRNMILAVGPTTPASVCWESHGDSESDENSSSSDYVDEDGDSDDDREEEEEDSEPDRCYTLQFEESDDSDEHADDSVAMERPGPQGALETHVESEATREARPHAVSVDYSSPLAQRRQRAQQQQQQVREQTISPSHQPPLEDPLLPRKKRWSPSMRHGGCINTACWLNDWDCPWRISTASQSIAFSHASPYAVASNETSTQIITSSDDRLIKVWDASHAMGMASPLPGGWDTFPPLALGRHPSEIGTQKQHSKWKKHYRRYGEQYNMAGSVHLLASVNSGHRGNVFHATPLGSAPGKVLTCGADGYLRITDLNSETSSAVINPYAIETHGHWEHLDAGIGGMAYSHLSLTPHTGLLCSERGLHHFDLRVPPDEQNRRSFMPTISLDKEGNEHDSDSGPVHRPAPCKTCAVWTPHWRHSQLGNSEPHMVFVGGASVFVELLDLRNGGNNKNVLQRFKPRCLKNDGDVSVSGLDVTKDGRELLVSYEGDQIYTFPIFPGAKSNDGPSLNDFDVASSFFNNSAEHFQPELAVYDGHLNRFTFLKNAKYAGPNDDYILTGSDSGKAWIYERKSGRVASLLSADSNTCNGFIPHPSLPFFVTYGIDSTAKLWRAADCVDTSFIDSPSARAMASLERYEMSPITLQCDAVQATLNLMLTKKAVLPDLVGTPTNATMMGRLSGHKCSEICGEGSARFGNAFRILPQVLRQTRYECYQNKKSSRLAPVEQPLEMVTVAASLNRLSHQATALGLRVNPWEPWIFEGSNVSQVHKADLVPDTPSDWLLYDKEMSRTPLNLQTLFNLLEYRDILQKTFPDNPVFFPSSGDRKCATKLPWLTDEQQRIPTSCDIETSQIDANDLKSRRTLLETVSLLKEGGNEAVAHKLFHAAIHRYDKSIQYCSVACMRHYEGRNGLKHLSELNNISMLMASVGIRHLRCVVTWSPLLRVLISSRLNLSLVLLKPEMAQISRAADQARFALQLLSPFTRKKGKIIVVIDDDEGQTSETTSEKEPEATYLEANALQSKAYFRLGSAEFESGNFAGATKSFAASLRSVRESTVGKVKSDAILMKRYQEAKRKNASQKKRTSNKFRKLLSNDMDTQKE